MKPFRFTPLLKSLIWGGDKIAAYKGLKTDVPNIGESWELSGVEGSESVVEGGEYAGCTLPQLIAELKGALVGEAVYKRFGTEFPLLVKFIDARADLSIQVHPNDELARVRHGKHGKTEMWYVVGADCGAHLKTGFAQPLTPAEYERRVADNTITDVLCDYAVQPGDLFFLPAGRVHALCAGTFVAEIQQTSDVTYRIYDYGRAGKDGKPRKLHTELAKDAIDYTVLPDYRSHYTDGKNREVELVACPYFVTSLYDLDRPVEKDLSQTDSFLVAMCLAGRGTLVDDEGSETPLRQGETLLVPASTRRVRFVPDETMKVLTSLCSSNTMKPEYSLPQDGGLGEEAAPRDIIHRYEKIRTQVFPAETDGVQYVADRIVRAISDYEKRPASSDFCDEPEPFVLGLTTGQTPVALYRELVRRYEAGEVSFANVAVFSLDEFYPIDADERQSRNHFIRKEFLERIDILPENIRIPDGTVPAERISDYCAAYERDIPKIDLMILGINRNGQVGFNEPGTYIKSHTRLVQLSHETRKVESRAFFSFDDTPKMAITLGLETILRAGRIFLLAWGEEKADAIRMVVEGEVTPKIPASYLQTHPDIEAVIDEKAAQQLTFKRYPWLVGPCAWTPKFTRKAVVWLCGVVGKPILKLTYKDYIENSLGELLEQGRSYDQINVDVFHDLQHTISGWPGGKPNADDSTRPVPSVPFPKRIAIFSPHPDDDVISMGGTFIRLVQQGHDVHVAYQTSGNVAVADDVVLQHIDTAREIGFGDRFAEVGHIIASKKKGEPEPRALLDIKGAIRRAEARAAVRSFGLDPDTNAHFLNMPFYETGGIKKGKLIDKDINLIVNLLRRVRPHQIYAAGDLADPHGTHRICTEAVLEAIEVVKDDDWFRECHLWLYRGAWLEWDLGMVDMAVPLSPEELIKKRHAIYRHLSQKDIMPFPGDDTREFWQRAEERTQHTARLYDALGMAEYQAIEVFVKMF